MGGYSTSCPESCFSPPCSLPTEAEGGVYYIPEDGTLVIEQADSSDDGVYICTGTNAFGSVESNDIELTFVRQSECFCCVGWLWYT